MMLISIAGKKALVTGASRGIGRSIAELLLKAGVEVAICGRDRENVRKAVAELSPLGRVVGEPADVAKESEVSNLFRSIDAQLGGLDILVNNAGVGIFRSVADASIDEWKAILETNLSGVFYCCREAIPRMRTRGGGFIVNISSLAGRNAFAGGSAYNASKFGLNGFSEAMMLDLRYDGIRVSYVMPGSVDTEFGQRSEHASWKIAPEDVAEAVLHVLRQPERTIISRVEMRPSKPPK
jgi:NAD(P)-dependent dehydrogenase (short-subunit alcohol dehydrogenase family)